MEDFETASAIDFYKQQCKNKNTDRATSTWMRNLQSWAVTKSMEPNIERVDPETLNKFLEVYFSELKKLDGKEYEPTSLCVMQAAVDRYLHEQKYQYSILRSPEFEGSRKVLEGKARYLRQEFG